MSLIEELVKKGLLDKKQAAFLRVKLKSSGKREEELLLDTRAVSEEVLFALKGRLLKIPLKEIRPEDVPLKILEFIPEEAARYYQMIPLVKRPDGILEVGMMYPEDLKAKEALNFLSRQSKFSYEVFLITPSTFTDFLKQYRTLRKEVKRVLEEIETEAEVEEEKRVRVSKRPELERLVEEAPITKVVAVMLRHAVEGKASDLHIEPTRERLRIRFRLDGILHASLFLPLKIHPAIIARLKILSNLKIDETRIPQDGRFSAKIAGKDIDFRVSTFPTSAGEKMVLRILDPAEGLKNLDKLGLEERNLRIVQKAIEKPFGLILATGPTASGKTTTLYAIINSLNKEGVNIMTLEDPVEYNIDGVNQSQIKTEIGYTFATGLRHVLRQDPDVIMVGEIRDEESADLAVHASLTGHIVLSTLHTSNAVGAIPRLLDLGIPAFLIPPGLSLIIAQRLVRVLCPHCKEKTKPSPRVKDIILKEMEFLSPALKAQKGFRSSFNVYRPKGCPKCKFKGYSGRLALFEVLEMTSQLADIVFKSPGEEKIIQEAQRQGMVTMRQEGVLKVLAGLTSMEEVIKETEEVIYK